MPKVKLADIRISTRQRKELEEADIKSLAQSIERYGLLNPITLNRDSDGGLELVAGFTRLQAHMALGKTEIEARFQDELSEIERKEIELEENIRRKNLEWWEEANAIAEIHELKQAEDPEWSMRQTAEYVGKSASTVSNSVDLKKAMGEDPDIKREKTLTGALKKRDTQKKIEKRKRDIEVRKRSGKRASIPAIVKTGDALELIREEPDESFDAVVTNFPFGVDLELKGGKQVYKDDEDYITELVMGVVEESFRVLRDDSWFVGWFDVRKITYNSYAKALYKKLRGENRDLALRAGGLALWLEEAGFSWVSVVPAIWVKPNKTQGIIGDPRKGMITAYEALVFASKGDAVLLRQGKQNIFIYDTPPGDERVHPLQMPTALCRDVISRVTLGGGRVLDPFAGSASIGLGALEHQCEFVGYELDPEKASNGNLRLQEHGFSEVNDEEE